MDLKRINRKRDIFKLRTDVKREKTSFEKRAETLFELAETNAKLKKGLGTSIVVILFLMIRRPPRSTLQVIINMLKR